MLNDNRIMVQVHKNKNNTNELFIKWNTLNKVNIKCSGSDCLNDVINNAYIVSKMNQNKFILPLCNDCYELSTNYINKSNGDFLDYGTFISVQKDLLLKYKG